MKICESDIEQYVIELLEQQESAYLLPEAQEDMCADSEALPNLKLLDTLLPKLMKWEIRVRA